MFTPLFQFRFPSSYTSSISTKIELLSHHKASTTFTTLLTHHFQFLCSSFSSTVAKMLVNIVLTFASRDTFAALGDTTSRERRLLELASELGNATTINPFSPFLNRSSIEIFHL